MPSMPEASSHWCRADVGVRKITTASFATMPSDVWVAKSIDRAIDRRTLEGLCREQRTSRAPCEVASFNNNTQQFQKPKSKSQLAHSLRFQRVGAEFMNLRLFLVSIVLPICLGFGCGMEPADELAEVTKIIGGTPETDKEYDPVLMLLINERELCTSTLIAPRVVLTAKHCIVNTSPPAVFVGLGNSVRRNQRYASVIDIRTTADTTIVGEDIALLFLSQSGALQPRRYVEVPQVLAGESVTLVGFGQQRVGPAGTGDVGVKMMTRSTVVTESEKEFRTRGPDTCFGDSGGPVFLDDGRVAGVVSRGSTNCDGISVYTRVDAFTAMISQAIEDAEIMPMVNTAPAQPSVTPPVTVPPTSLHDDEAAQRMTAPESRGTLRGASLCSAGKQTQPSDAGLIFVVIGFGAVWRRRNKSEVSRNCLHH